MRYSFPLAFAANAFSMTALLVVLGIGGRAELAADAAVVQAATVMLFYAFSANARNLILNPERPVPLRALLLARLGLIGPLGMAAYALSAWAAGVSAWLAVALIVRRSAEWINELHLSDRELAADRQFAGRFTVLQGASFFTIPLAMLHSERAVQLAVMAWGLAPALVSIRFALRQCRSRGKFWPWWRELVPHMGSTVAIGVSVYAFRVLILGLVDKSTAGDLFTAYAMGGILSSLFATAIGPTYVFQRQLGIRRSMSREILALAGGCAVLGLALFWFASSAGDQALWLGKTSDFWKAAGMSLVGGGIMLLAQLERLELLQTGRDSLFGPDVLSNLAAVFAVPAGVLILGRSWLHYAYLWNAVVVLAFYAGVRQTNRWHEKHPAILPVLKVAVAVAIFLPIFFTAAHGLFRDPSFRYNSQGQLAQLPIPLSVFACYAGILLLGKYERARAGLATLFAMFVLIALPALAITAGDLSAGRDKLVLMIQYLLPIPALILGQQFATREFPRDRLPKIALALVAVLVPFQIFGSLIQGTVLLQPRYGVFSIYQHLQYVPTIVAGLYFVALFALFDRPRTRALLWGLGPLMGAYVTASFSRLSMGVLAVGLLVFLVRSLAVRTWRWQAVTLCLMAAIGGAVASTQLKTNSMWRDKFEITAGFEKGRWEYWQHYARAIAENPQCLLVGSAQPPSRREAPSAHNYYLDATYNFGIGAVLPLLALLGLTMRELVRHRRRLLASPDVLGLAVVVLLVALADNSFKVTFRQPYPGIASLFLWGTLLARLAQLRNEEKVIDSVATDRTTHRPHAVPRPVSSSVAESEQLVEV